MTVVTYVENRDSSDHTGILILRNGGLLLTRGKSADLTDAEIQWLSRQYVLVPGGADPLAAPETHPVEAAVDTELLYRIDGSMKTQVSVPVALGTGLGLNTTDPLNPVLFADLAPPPLIVVNSGSGIAPPFQNSATNLGGGFAVAAFVKLPSGLVLMQGNVVCTSTTVFTLPAGYPPSAGEIFACGLNGGVGNLIVYPNGVVGFSAAPTSYGGLKAWWWAAP